MRGVPPDSSREWLEASEIIALLESVAVEALLARQRRTRCRTPSSRKTAHARASLGSSDMLERAGPLGHS